jgi:predicted DNA-binding transcriptional regulator YafY
MRADRLLEIMLLLQTRGKMTAKCLSDELGVSRRTILRDIDALSFAGVPVYAEGGHGGGYALDDGYRTTLSGLQDAEARTLFVAGNNQLLEEVGLGEAARRALLKLLAAVPAAHRPAVEHMRQRILIDPMWWWRDEQPLPFWDSLQQAVFEDRCIRGAYEHADGQVVEHDLEPYSLVAKSSVWYLVARRGEDLRTYRVSRFHEVTVLEARFRRREDFDLPAYWQEHVQEFATTVPAYPFTLRIHPARVNFARWLAPGRCHILETDEANGWATARFEFESMELAKMLVLGLGCQAVVVEPPELHTAVLNTAQEILEWNKETGNVANRDNSSDPGNRGSTF